MPPSWCSRNGSAPTSPCEDGQVIEGPNGEVLWGCNDSNNTMVYRISGWDGWERKSGKVTLQADPPSAKFQGTGLAAEYYASMDLTGQAALKRVDPTVWFGPMWGDHREAPTMNEMFPNDRNAALDAGKCCSAR